MPETAGAEPRFADDETDDLIDIRELISVFRRRFWVFLGTAAFVVAIAIIVTFQMTPSLSLGARGRSLLQRL